jgi:hypothetical protein
LTQLSVIADGGTISCRCPSFLISLSLCLLPVSLVVAGNLAEAKVEVSPAHPKTSAAALISPKEPSFLYTKHVTVYIRLGLRPNALYSLTHAYKQRHAQQSLNGWELLRA